MKISVIQSNIVWEDKSLNFNNLDSLIMPLFQKTDIVVLPEMFTTGFSMNPKLHGESMDGDTFKWMKLTAEKGNFAICGSYIVEEDKNRFNRFVFITPGKEYWYYDKRHLFSIYGEDKLFSQGKSRLTINFRGVSICPYICYDLRFPVWSRNTNSCILMIYVANWPESRRDVWNTLLKARAIENQCYVAGVNRVGTDGEGIRYCGDSVILNPRGNIIASAGYDEEGVATGEISLKELSDFRIKFPVMNDADSFTLIP